MLCKWEDSLNQHADGRVRCVLQDQPSILCYNGVLRYVEVIQTEPRARCVCEDQHGNSDYDGVLLLIAITHVAVLDPG